MALRKLPGALALGLLASLATHSVLYGGEHAMGGNYNALLVQAALTSAIGLLIVFGAFAWSAARFAVDGSILATRLSERLPDFASVLAAAALWFALAEALEPRHTGAPALLMILCLAIASWLVGMVARALVAALASLIIAVSRLVFSSRTPSWSRHPNVQPLARIAPCMRRRFARPPPIAIAPSA